MTHRLRHFNACDRNIEQNVIYIWRLFYEHQINCRCCRTWRVVSSVCVRFTKMRLNCSTIIAGYIASHENVAYTKYGKQRLNDLQCIFQVHRMGRCVGGKSALFISCSSRFVATNIICKLLFAVINRCKTFFAHCTLMRPWFVMRWMFNYIRWMFNDIGMICFSHKLCATPCIYTTSQT